MNTGKTYVLSFFSFLSLFDDLLVPSARARLPFYKTYNAVRDVWQSFGFLL